MQGVESTDDLGVITPPPSFSPHEVEENTDLGALPTPPPSAPPQEVEENTDLGVIPSPPPSTPFEGVVEVSSDGREDVALTVEVGVGGEFIGEGLGFPEKEGLIETKESSATESYNFEVLPGSTPS